MTESTPPTTAPEQVEGDSLPTLRRIAEFIRNVLRLERNIESIKQENQFLKDRIETMQRQLDEQSGQLKVLVDFVTRSLDDKVAARAEEAAIRAFERMALALDLSRRIGPSPDEQK